MIKLTISYDGTNYCGWQKQKNGQSVQQVLEKALQDLTGKKIAITGSGRTDAGVHAEGQVASFNNSSLTIPPEKFAKALNTFLPYDVRVLSSEEASKDFHAVKSAKRKTYTYSFYVSQVEKPLLERYATKVDKMPDVDLMKKGAKIFIGEHDFACFKASGSSAKTTVRTIYDISISCEEEQLKITVTGNGFLYNMVRILSGTLLELGQGRLTLENLQNMLINKDRKSGGKTLCAKGLCLKSVEY